MAQSSDTNRPPRADHSSAGLDTSVLGSNYIPETLALVYSQGGATAESVWRFVFGGDATTRHARRILNRLKDSGYLGSFRPVVPKDMRRLVQTPSGKIGSAESKRLPDLYHLLDGEPIFTGHRFAVGEPPQGHEQKRKIRTRYYSAYQGREANHVLLLIRYLCLLHEGLTGIGGRVGQPALPLTNPIRTHDFSGASLLGEAMRESRAASNKGAEGRRRRPDGAVRLFDERFIGPASVCYIESHTGTQHQLARVTKRIVDYLKALDLLTETGRRPINQMPESAIPRIVYIAPDENRAAFIARCAARASGRDEGNPGAEPSPGLYSNLKKTFARSYGLDLDDHLLVTSLERIGTLGDPSYTSDPCARLGAGQVYHRAFVSDWRDIILPNGPKTSRPRPYGDASNLVAYPGLLPPGSPAPGSSPENPEKEESAPQPPESEIASGGLPGQDDFPRATSPGDEGVTEPSAPRRRRRRRPPPP